MRCYFSGVSECIIMGIPMGIGTGLFKLLHKYPLSLVYLFRQYHYVINTFPFTDVRAVVLDVINSYYIHLQIIQFYIITAM